MVRNIVKAIVVLAAVVGMVGVLQSTANAERGGQNPPGNNGTIKVGGVDLDNGNANNPHIDGCSLQVQFFGYDAGARTATITFESQAPTPNTLTSPVGPQTFNFTGGGSGNQLNGTAQYVLSFQGSPQPNQGYHVKVTVHADGSQGNDTKSKVFWVEGCSGTSKYTLDCEEITLNKPTVKPEGASFEYLIDGAPAALGSHEVTAGEHTITLMVNGVLVSSEEVNVEKCEGEEKPADVSVTTNCDPTTNLFTFTIKNAGEASAEVMFNAETFTLAGGASTTRTLAAGQALTLKVDGVVYQTDGGEKYENKVFVSCQGQGSTEVPVTPAGGQGAATGVASLPYTGSAGGQIASLIALIASVATAIGGYVLRNRAVSSL